MIHIILKALKKLYGLYISLYITIPLQINLFAIKIKVIKQSLFVCHSTIQKLHQ